MSIDSKVMSYTFTALAVIVGAAPAAAAEWTNSAGLGLGSYYSTNICLSPTDEQNEVVGTVTPRVDVRGEGARAELSLRASVEYNSLAESSVQCAGGGAQNIQNREAFVPRVDFNSELEAIEDSVFLEANAFAGQNAFNPFIAGGDDNVNGTGNQNVTYRWGAGARIDRPLGDTGSVFLRYNYNEQYNSFNQALGNSTEDRVELDVGRDPTAARFSFGLTGAYSEVTFEETLTQPEFVNRLSRLQLRAALQTSNSWQLNGYVGEEDNLFISYEDEIDGSFWDVGVRWTPNARVTFDVGYGERFFGDAPRLTVEYRHKRHFLSADYLKDLQFPRNIRGSDGSFDPDDPLDVSVGLPGDPTGVSGDPTFIGQRPVLNERFQLRYRFEARRTSLSLSLADSQQTATIDGAQGSFQSANLLLTRQLGPRFSVDVGLGWRENTADRTEDAGNFFAQDLEAWNASIGVRQSLARDTTLSLRYQYTDQTSDADFNNFVENRLLLGLNFNF